jgi:hypothetical protein
VAAVLKGVWRRIIDLVLFLRAASPRRSWWSDGVECLRPGSIRGLGCGLLPLRYAPTGSPADCRHSPGPSPKHSTDRTTHGGPEREAAQYPTQHTARSSCWGGCSRSPSTSTKRRADWPTHCGSESHAGEHPGRSAATAMLGGQMEDESCCCRGLGLPFGHPSCDVSRLEISERHQLYWCYHHDEHKSRRPPWARCAGRNAFLPEVIAHESLIPRPAASRQQHSVAHTAAHTTVSRVTVRVRITRFRRYSDAIQTPYYPVLDARWRPKPSVPLSVSRVHRERAGVVEHHTGPQLSRGTQTRPQI